MPAHSFAKWFVTMAVPKAQHFDDSIRFFYEVKDAIRALEDRQLLRFRIGRAQKMTARARRASIAQLAHRFSRKIVRVLLATPRFIAVGPIANDFSDVRPRALRENYAEVLRGHRSCTFARNSSPP